MLKQYLYPGPTLSYLIGLLGIGFSMSSLPLVFRIIIAIISISILVFTAGIKLEEYLKKRHQRMMRENTRGMKAFLTFLEGSSGEIENLDEDQIEDLVEAHEDFTN